MNKDLDKLLSEELLTVPDDFAVKVMQRIDYLPLPRQRLRFYDVLQKLALAAAGIAGAAQLAAFIFAFWATSTAG
jgi:hypothetical protein